MPKKKNIAQEELTEVSCGQRMTKKPQDPNSGCHGRGLYGSITQGHIGEVAEKNQLWCMNTRRTPIEALQRVTIQSASRSMGEEMFEITSNLRDQPLPDDPHLQATIPLHHLNILHHG